MRDIHVIYHKADYDGKFSAAVALQALLPVKYKEQALVLHPWDYQDPTPTIPNGVDLYMLDISVEPLMDYPGLIWIDHHISAINKYPKSIRGLRIDGVAACRLCWSYFVHSPPPRLALSFRNRSVHEPLALTLAGEFDVFDLHDDRTVPFQFGLEAEGINSPEALALLLNDSGNYGVEKFVGIGRSAYKWQQQFAEKVLSEYGYIVELDGLHFLCLMSVHARSSLWFAGYGIAHSEVDGLMCCRYDGNGKLTVSLYGSDLRNVDLSKIAVQFGGGGHARACGFTIDVSLALDLGIIKTEPDE